MANFVLTDTDLLIDAGRSIVEAIERLNAEEQKTPLAISVVT